MINFTCPQCGAAYEVDDSYAGCEVECGVCKHTFSTPCSQDVFSRGHITWITCPHCWQRFDSREVKYISRHLDLIGDPILGEDAQRRFVPVQYAANGMALDERGMECPEMACPSCHLKIPESVINLPSSIFSIVGAPASGKSYFLTTMMWQIRKFLPTYFAFNLADVDSSFNSVLNEYESILFMNNHPDRLVSLPKTELQGSGYTNQIMMKGFPVDLPKPFIFALTPTSSHPDIDTRSRELERNIILYDNAGEHFQPGNESVNNLATNHLAYSDGIIFVYDPLRESRLRNYCTKDDPQFELESTNQLALFYEMANRVRKFTGLGATEKYRQPLVIAIAKFDALKEGLGLKPGELDYLHYDEKNFEYSIDLQNITNMSFLLREKLLEIAPEFVGAAEGFSETVYFVPVSSFGCSPQVMSGESSGSGIRQKVLGIVPNDIKPFWTEVPFLLQFYLHGLLPAFAGEVADAGEISNYKFAKDVIVFSLPGSTKRCELPSTYWGWAIYNSADGKYYRLPTQDGYKDDRQIRAASLDEQIDSDFWNQQ